MADHFEPDEVMHVVKVTAVVPVPTEVRDTGHGGEVKLGVAG